MKRFGIAIIVLAVIALAGWLLIHVRMVPRPSAQACTLEAKLCPDGTVVGRTGPNCAFAQCPEVSTSTTTTESDGSVAPTPSGVRGLVTLGPTCPVEKNPPDPACADKPYATAIAVYRKASDTPYIIGNSDKTGAFEFLLPPGAYVLKPSSGTTYPVCARADIIVPAVGYATTTIACDSGIR